MKLPRQLEKGAAEISVPNCKYTSSVTNDGGVVDELDLVVNELDFFFQIFIDRAFSTKDNF